MTEENQKYISDISRNRKEHICLDEKLFRYQIEELHKEISYLKRKLQLIPRPVQLLCKELRQLWWTLTSIIGLKLLHDGSLNKAPSDASTPTVALPIITPSDMPNPRLFLDVTVTYKSKINSGVQRVIRELCRHGKINGALAPVIISDGHFVTTPDHERISFRRGDKLLLLDSSWTNTNIYPEALKFAKNDGADIILGIYDLIPSNQPGFVHPYYTVLFEEWLITISPYCCAALAISRFSADAFVDWASKRSALTTIKKIGWFQLGADVPQVMELNRVAPSQNEYLPDNYLLSVGTIEPRKGYSVALDAFDNLWSSGVSLNYVIVGRRGDLSSHIVERITNHPQFGKKLFWPQNVDDKQLHKYYKNTTGLLIPALAEGYGLPLIEASFYQKPIIASDIPVFREIAPKGVIFYSACSSTDLAETIKHTSFCEIYTEKEHVLSWEEATSNMISMIKNSNYQMNL
jgi:glycosyltransferase involved in cell wall biosynthesis